MKKIKSFFRFVFVYKTPTWSKSGMTKWQRVRFWMRNNLVRRPAMFVMLGTLACVPAYVYHEASPKIAQADAIVNTVTVERKLVLSDFPMLMRICHAESQGKQFKANGDVVRGIVNHSDVGLCQINEAINNDQARRLGYDIFTEEGNVDMAIWMFVNQGVRPWESSRCLGPNHTVGGGWGTAAECAAK